MAKASQKLKDSLESGDHETAVMKIENPSKHITESTGNVFADLGLPNPEEELAKAKLVSALAEVIAERALSQTKVAAILGVDQPTISKLLRGRTEGLTCDRLMRLLNLLDQDVDISVRPKRTNDARISVSVAHVV